MSVTELRPPEPSPDPGIVALLATFGLTDERCASATWSEVKAARVILEAAALIATLRVEAADIITDRMRAAGCTSTVGDYFNSLDDENRERMQALLLMLQMPSPIEAGV